MVNLPFPPVLFPLPQNFPSLSPSIPPNHPIHWHQNPMSPLNLVALPKFHLLLFHNDEDRCTTSKTEFQAITVSLGRLNLVSRGMQYCSEKSLKNASIFPLNDSETRKMAPPAALRLSEWCLPPSPVKSNEKWNLPQLMHHISRGDCSLNYPTWRPSRFPM